MRKVLAVVVVALILGAFVGGYWPQRAEVARARAEAAECQRQLAESRVAIAGLEARVRLSGIFGRFLALRDAAEVGNFGDARGMSSPFFDAVREEADKAPGATVSAALERVLARRDAVTAGLARNEASIREVLVAIERELRRVQGYPVPATATEAPAQPAAQPPAKAGPAAS